ncbi:hypothetical protein [Massilia sp. YMA4]|uniref:hypothetical protein n=1 Tax=Massilia sp. YMA4 TaxID=1593482 RepID=UPI0035A323B9
MWHVESDYQGASGSLGLTRTYNSLPEFLDADISRLFGARWTHPYDAVLIAEKTLPAGKQPGQCWQRSDTLTLWCASPPAAASAVPQTVSIQRGDGKRFYFNKSNQAHVSVSGEPDRLQPSYAPDGSIGSWTLTTADDIRETFDAGGRLLSVTARNGTVQRMTYSDGKNNESRLGRLPANAPACGTVLAGRAPALGKLLCVTDHYGRQLHFGYDTYGRVKLALSPGERSRHTNTMARRAVAQLPVIFPIRPVRPTISPK